MATDLDIRMKVDSSQIDQAAQKVGQLKQLSSTIGIQYDIDGKPLDVVIDKSVNLRKQVVDLTKALRSVKEGSAEFRILSSALGDAQDKLAASNAKSRDLLGSLQLIPGPIGQIASQLNGAISALKLFSGFSLKDIKFQFKELNNDLNDIVKNLFGVGGAANKAKAELVDTAATAGNTAAEAANTTVTTENAAAQVKSAEAKAADAAATEADTAATIANSEAKRVNTVEDFEAQIAKEKNVQLSIAEVEAKQAELVARTEVLKQQILNNTISEQEARITTEQIALEAELLQAKFLKTQQDAKDAVVSAQNIIAIEAETIAQEAQTVAVEADTVAKEANNVATKGLLASIKAFASTTLGIITIIAAAGYALYELITYTKELTKEQKLANEVNEKAAKDSGELISKLEFLNEQVKKGGLTQREKNKAVNEYNEKLGETLGKVKTYAELEKKLKDSGPDYITYLGLKAEAEAAYGLAVEKNKLLIEARTKVENVSVYDVWKEGGILGLFYEGKAGTADAIKARTIKGLEDGKSALLGLFNTVNAKAQALAGKLNLPVGEIKTDGKTETVKPKELQDDALLQKEKELTAALIKEQKDREIQQLLIAKDKEKKEIEGLNISKKNEGVRTSALLALENKFQIEKAAIVKKYDDEQKKKDEELAKSKKDAADQLREYAINSIKDEVAKSRVERLKQFQDEKDKLDQYLKDGLITREKYNEAILNMQKAFANDIEKINTDARIKELEATKAVDESRLRIFQMNMDQSNATRIGYLEQYFAQQLKVEDDNYKIQRERYKNNANELLRIETEHSNNVAAIKEAERRQKFDIYEKGLDDLSNVFAAESDLQRAAIIAKQVLLGIELGIEISKTIAFSKLALARSKVAVAEGTAQTAKIGFPQNVIPLALYAIQAALIISSIIKATKAADAATGAKTQDVPQAGKNYGKGGIIEGPSHSSAAGGTPIMAEGGEAVMTKGAVTAFRPLLSMLNQMGGGTAFGGGVVGQAPFDNPDTADKTMEPQIIKTYIVERDLTSTQERQARLKSLSTL